MNTRPTYYEWDEVKRKANIAKHGVDFAAMDAFEWNTAVIELDDNEDEERWTAKGFIGVRLHVVVYTERGESDRIISLRKARPREERSYAQDRRR